MVTEDHNPARDGTRDAGCGRTRNRQTVVRPRGERGIICGNGLSKFLFWARASVAPILPEASSSGEALAERHQRLSQVRDRVIRAQKLERPAADARGPRHTARAMGGPGPGKASRKRRRQLETRQGRIRVTAIRLAGLPTLLVRVHGQAASGAGGSKSGTETARHRAASWQLLLLARGQEIFSRCHCAHAGTRIECRLALDLIEVCYACFAGKCSSSDAWA